MRILLCKGQIYGPISGSDETLVTYASQLRKAGLDVSVLLMYLHAEEDQYYQRLLEAEVPVLWIASDLAQSSLGAGRKLAYRVFNTFPSTRRIIRRSALRVASGLVSRYLHRCREIMERKNPDVVHVITPDPSASVMIRAAYDGGFPVIYQELGIPYHPPHFESSYEQFSCVLPLCSKVTALSPTLLEHCREKLSAQVELSVLPIMSHAMPHGINHNRQHTQRITFGFAARIEEIKGPMILMEAFGAVVRECGDIYLSIAGDGSQRQRIAARAKALGIAGRYRYHGVYAHPEDCRAFMESLDVFVMPSFSEGTPNSVVEAMACGKPIIGSAVGGMSDMIAPDCGILVPPGDISALAAAILRLANNPELRLRMGAAAKKRFQQLFSPVAVMPLMLETYREVSKNGNPHKSAGENQLHPWATV